jgi:hypothetical protein
MDDEQTYTAGEYKTGALDQPFFLVLPERRDLLHCVFHDCLAGSVRLPDAEFTIETDADGNPSGTVLARGKIGDRVSLEPIYPCWVDVLCDPNGFIRITHKPIEPPEEVTLYCGGPEGQDLKPGGTLLID